MIDAKTLKLNNRKIKMKRQVLASTIKNLSYILFALFIGTLSSFANAQLLDDGSGYNEWKEIRNNLASNQYAQGTLTTVYTLPAISKRTLETISLAQPDNYSNTEINNLVLRLNADALGRNLFNGAALVYENVPWSAGKVVNGVVITTSNTTSFTETANTQIPNVPGARIRAILYTASGSSYTTPFVKLSPNARNVIPVTPGIITPTKIRIELWNVNRLHTQFKVETIDVSNPGNTCTQ
jgi:hypothetical protein